ncbi:MAG: hypothetical protein K2X38_04315 [Gemmataceae bacterium]|nr:hypothetical protein [Gemmataceae bacterium]
MIGVTIGVGEGYAEEARASAEAAAKYLCLSDVLILGDDHLRQYVGEATCAEDVYRLKFFIPQIVGLATPYVYFDADWRIRRHPPMQVMLQVNAASTICAVRDRPYAVPTHFPDFQFDYANAGFYVMPGVVGHHVASWCLNHICGDFLAEQTTWNRAIRALGLPIRWLNRSMNWMPLGGELAVPVDPIASHAKDHPPMEGIQPNVQAMVENSTPTLLADGWTTYGGAWVYDGAKAIVFHSDGSLA